MVKTKISKTPFDFDENAATGQGSVINILNGLQQELDKIKGKVHNGSHTVLQV